MTRTPALLLLAAIALASGGCPIGNDRLPKPRDLPPAWRIDKLRLLAVVAEPPEAAPGDIVTFSALVLDPDEVVGLRAWIACPPEEPGGIGFGCGLPTDLDLSDPSAFAEAGVIGVEPGLPPAYRVPEDALDGLTELEAADGVYVLTQLAILPQEVLDAAPEDGLGDIDFNEVEVGYKRLVVSSSATPNRNPTILRWRVDGLSVPDGAVVEVDSGERYEVGIELTDDSVETYTYVNPDGESEERVEEPYAKWYSDGGTVEEDATLFPFLDADWRAPDPAATEEGEPEPATAGTWWVVVRDRRGGMTWSSLPWRLR